MSLLHAVRHNTPVRKSDQSQLAAIPEMAFAISSTYSPTKDLQALIGVAVSGYSRWPTPEDWVRVRPIVRRLYITEQRTLNTVMAIMAKDHGFYAT